MRVHGWLTATEPWLYGPEVESITRKYIDLRYRMLPYTYSEAAQVTMHGSTLLRPLVMDFAQDETALQQKFEFMFGKGFLGAPVLAPGVQSWDVYLPRCTSGWVNFWTGQKLQGGQTIKAAAKLDEMPLFVRAGSIVPLGPTEQWTGEKPDAPIEIRVYPGADATFSLYEGEGTNYNYEKGSYSIIPIQWDDRSRKLTIGKREGGFSGMRSERRFESVVVGSGQIEKATMPVDVEYAGKLVSTRLN